MRYFLLLACILVSTISIAQPTKVEMTPMQDHYYIGGDRFLDEDVNCFVLQEMEEYLDFFGKTRRADTPDFSKEWMLILIVPQTKKDIQMKFNRVSMKAGSFIEVYCDLGKLKGKMLTYEQYPLAACTIPKYSNIKTIKFYEEKKGGGLIHLEDVSVK